MLLAVRMVSMRRILERFLALVLSAFLKSSQSRCFLLLLHFVLNFAPPRYNGISTVTLKCIANGRGFFLWLTSVGVFVPAGLYLSYV